MSVFENNFFFFFFFWNKDLSLALVYSFLMWDLQNMLVLLPKVTFKFMN